MQICQLSRLSLIGPIDSQTPECVISEIVATHGCIVLGCPVSTADHVSNLIRVLQATTTLDLKIHPDLTPDNLPLLARFVNAERHTWTVKTLFLAYDHLNLFIQGARVLPNGPWTAGPKTPNHPLSYDACMLYSLCRYHQIQTSRHTTLQQMTRAIQSLLLDPADVRDTVRAQIESLPLNRLIEISISEPTLDVYAPGPKPPAYGHRGTEAVSTDRIRLPDIVGCKLKMSAIDDAIQLFNASTPILCRLQPQSHEEAVVLGAKIYGLNLVESVNPNLEYQALLKLGNPNMLDRLVQYRPVDPIFRERYLRNPEWYQITQTLVPELAAMYTPTQLTSLAISAGYSLVDIRGSSTVQLLQFSRENPTFYGGKSPYNQCSRSPIYLEDLQNLQTAMCISYGVVATETVVTYMIPELVEHFRTSKSFSNPQNIRESFPPISIRKLKLLCWNRVKSLELSVVKTANQSLLDAIEFVECCNRANSSQAQALKATYINSTVEEQSAIERALQLLLELSMYMRGWKVSTSCRYKYPITAEETTFDSENLGQVFLNVTHAIGAFSDQIVNLKEALRDQFSRLPLIRVIKTQPGLGDPNRGLGGLTTPGLSFQASSAAEHGLTILERVQIVKTGDSSSGSYSCIRLSSNWLAASAWYYLSAIGMKPPFEIELLSQIS